MLNNLSDYVNGRATPAEREDFEEHIYDKIFSWFLEKLPENPEIKPDIWTDGVEILCRTEDICERIADALDSISGEPESHTGYYDPVDDARSGEVDDHTGWYYIDYD